MTRRPVLAMIGFGEVGQALAAALAATQPRPRAFDLKFTDPDSGPARAAEAGLASVCASAAEAVAGADLVLSAVTAAQTVAAAAMAAPGLAPAAWYLDLNSASPQAKIAAAAHINQAGGRYVEVAVMSPIEPKRQASPMLLGGPYARDVAPVIRDLGFTGARFYSEQYGQAAATKLCRSVMVKGMEALIVESLLSARHFGVEGEVLESLGNLFPHPDWPDHARYMIERSVTHGIRRAEEMREAAATVAGAGVTPWMSEAIATRQAWAAGYAAALSESELGRLLDAIRAQMAGDVATPES